MSDKDNVRPEDREPDLARRVVVGLDATVTLDDLVTMTHAALTDDTRLDAQAAEDSLVEFVIALDQHVGEWSFTLRLAAHFEQERLAFEADRPGDADEADADVATDAEAEGE